MEFFQKSSLFILFAKDLVLISEGRNLLNDKLDTKKSFWELNADVLEKSVEWSEYQAPTQE